MKNTLVQGNLHCLKYFVPKKKLHYCKFYTVQNYTVRGIAVYIYLKSELTENPAEKRIILPSSRIIKIGQYLAFERSSKIEDNICDLADEGNLT